MSRTMKRIIAVSVAFLVIAVGVWFYAYTSIKVRQVETYEGKIRLTSMTIDEAKHLKHKFRVRRMAWHHISTKQSKTTRSVGTCYTNTAHGWQGNRALMNVLEEWVQFHWCSKKSNDTQIARAKVQAIRTDTCCLLNPWQFDHQEVTGGRYWDGVAYSEIARKVVYITFQQKIGPLGLFHKTVYFDCRLNALHGWFACHSDFGTTPSDWAPSW